jgi:hypothetical protein
VSSTSTSTSGSTSSAASSSAKNINKRRTSRETGAPNEDEAINAIAPFYRFILAAAFRDLDKEKTNSLSIASLNTLNMECGQQRISSSAMNWFLHNFDQENGGLTEKGLLEYFCWIAEAGKVYSPPTPILNELTLLSTV